MTTATYTETAGHLLAQAHTELAQGDVMQASEKGWGAAAQMVKAVAERRGWQHRSHAALFRAIDNLTTGTGDDDISRLFAVANSLHVNFYENWDTAENVARHLADVTRLVDKLRPLAGEAAAPSQLPP